MAAPKKCEKTERTVLRRSTLPLRGVNLATFLIYSNLEGRNNILWQSGGHFLAIICLKEVVNIQFSLIHMHST